MSRWAGGWVGGRTRSTLSKETCRERGLPIPTYRWVGGWVGGWVVELDRGERGGSNELGFGWVGGWVGGWVERGAEVYWVGGWVSTSFIR